MSATDPARLATTPAREIRTRPKDRKEQIVRAAARLFRERGYPAVSIYDIGEAVGTSGAALYRHFANKEALLVAAYRRSIEQVDRVNQETQRVSSGRSARRRLKAILHADLLWTLEDPDFAAIYLREVRHIDVRPADALEAQRRHIQLWADLLGEIAPNLTREQSRFIVFSVSGLTASVLYYRPELSAKRLADLLARAGMAAMEQAATVDAGALPRPGKQGGQRKASQPRRERILWEALRLFRRQGFNGVSIDEIGEAAGITGPSVYRHFPSKEDILGAAFELGDEQIFASADESLAVARSPRDALERLVASYVERATENADLVAVFMTESRALPRERELLVRREQRRYVGKWVEVLRRLRPRLSEREARALVQAAFGIINAGVQRNAELSPAAAAETLRAMATGALLA